MSRVRRLGNSALLIAGLASLAATNTPALAQQEDFVPAFSAENDLDCAIFVAALIGESEEVLSVDDRIGLTSAFTYFTGRYEAQRGLDLTRAMADRLPIYLASNPAEIQQTCSVRMRAFGARLQEAGSTLRRLQEVPPAETASEDADTDAVSETQ